MNRNLDGVFFRIGKENICFSDLTDEQKTNVMKNKDTEWLKSLCIILGNTIKKIGDQLNIVKE